MNALYAISIAIQKRVGRQRLRMVMLGSLPFVAMISLWHLNTVNEWLPPVYIPPIASIFEAIVTLQDECT